MVYNYYLVLNLTTDNKVTKKAPIFPSKKWKILEIDQKYSKNTLNKNLLKRLELASKQKQKNPEYIEIFLLYT